MTDIERQILLNHIAILEALIPLSPPANGPSSTREILRQRYRESAELVRQHHPTPQR